MVRRDLERQPHVEYLLGGLVQVSAPPFSPLVTVHVSQRAVLPRLIRIMADVYRLAGHKFDYPRIWLLAGAAAVRDRHDVAGNIGQCFEGQDV